jgi:hypothetical protein
MQMMTLTALGTLILGLARLQAQDPADPVEQRVQRLKQQLQLTDDQVSKARDIYKKQNDDLHALLTDDQKRQYDQTNRGFGGRQGANPQGGNPPGGFGRTGGLPSTDDLKTQLSLTDDQVTKINSIRDASRQDLRNLFRNRQRGTNPTDQLQKIRDETNQKIREVLTDEQKPKFDELVKASENQPAPTFQRGNRGGTVEERVKSAMDRLKVADAKEAEAIRSLLQKVVELMDKLDAYGRDERTKLDEASRNQDLSDQALGERVEGLLKGRRDIEKDLSGARKGLAEVVTNRQEVELMRLGLLR